VSQQTARAQATTYLCLEDSLGFQAQERSQCYRTCHLKELGIALPMSAGRCGSLLG